MVAFVREQGLTVEWILDTHPHADHFSAAPYLKEVFGAPTAIGEHVVTVQKIWKEIYHLPDFPADGSQWDRLFKDGERFRIGELEAEVIFSPGHTAASITYRRRRRRLHPRHAVHARRRHGARRLPRRRRPRALPQHPPHPGAAAARRACSPATTTSRAGASRGGNPPSREQREHNIHVHDGVTEDAFVRMREERDRTLAFPGLLLDALADQYPWRAAARAGGERRFLPEDSAELLPRDRLRGHPRTLKAEPYPMENFTPLSAILGGVLIGLSVVLLLLTNGRIAGISGVVGGLWAEVRRRRVAAGLPPGPVAAPLALCAWSGVVPADRVTSSTGLLIAAGLLVGFGARLGSGCTSGHGVAGIARLSPPLDRRHGACF